MILFGPFEFGNWDLFEVCLPAGRQGYWDLEFLLIASESLSQRHMPNFHIYNPAAFLSSSAL